MSHTILAYHSTLFCSKCRLSNNLTPPANNILPLPTPYFKMFWKDSLMNPTHFENLSLLPPSLLHPPLLPHLLKILIAHKTILFDLLGSIQAVIVFKGTATGLKKVIIMGFWYMCFLLYSLPYLNKLFNLCPFMQTVVPHENNAESFFQTHTQSP